MEGLIFPESLREARWNLHTHLLSSSSIRPPRQLQLTVPSGVRRHRSPQPPFWTLHGDSSPETQGQGNLMYLHNSAQQSMQKSLNNNIKQQTNKNTEKSHSKVFEVSNPQNFELKQLCFLKKSWLHWQMQYIRGLFTEYPGVPTKCSS